MPSSNRRQKVSDRGVTAKGNALKSLRVAVGVCGGVASVEVVKIIREIRRFGATVKVFTTPEVKKFITALPLAWASGESVVEDASAEVEYLSEFDAVLICPATLNTMTKCALGLADNAVTLLVASQWNRAKIFFVPTMNLQMWEHPRFPEHQASIEKFGGRFFPQRTEEERLKMPAPEELVAWLIKEMKK